MNIMHKTAILTNRYIIIKTRLFILYLLLATCYLLPALDGDFGLAINQYVSYGDLGEENVFEYRADILPRFSLLFGDAGSFFISGGLSLGVDDGFFVVPELLRTELAMRFGSIGLRAGRLSYSDPLNFIAEGLFDGLGLNHTSSLGKFGFGLWYTGLLYKKNAKITMTAQDQSAYFQPLYYADFTNTYFAARRMLASLDWEHLAIAERIGLKVSVIGQIDLNGRNEKLHTQYFVFKTDIPANRFLFELGGSLQTAQYEAAGSSFNIAFAGMGGVNYLFGKSRLSLNARYSSGESQGGIGAFVPVTSKYYGQLFQPRMTALTVIGLNYSARLSQKFGAAANAAYFIRSDTVTPNSFSYTSAGDGGKLLGAEFFARLVWSPVSDVQFNLGGGAFIPALGNNWKNESPLWKIDLSAVLAIL